MSSANLRLTTSTLALAGCVGAAALCAPCEAGPRSARRWGPGQTLELRLNAARPAYEPGASASGPIGKSPVRNFGEVAPGTIYRSGQPTEQDFVWLKSQGFRSIVSLRKEHDDGAERMAKHGFNYLYLPIVDQKAPSREQAESFLRFARQPQNWPLLVHCEGGLGRAATMAALVRHSFDGWGMSTALRESRKYRPLAFPMFGSQLRFLKKWAREHGRGELRPQVGGGGESAAATD